MLPPGRTPARRHPQKKAHLGQAGRALPHLHVNRIRKHKQPSTTARGTTPFPPLFSLPPQLGTALTHYHYQHAPLANTVCNSHPIIIIKLPTLGNSRAFTDHLTGNSLLKIIASWSRILGDSIDTNFPSSKSLHRQKPKKCPAPTVGCRGSERPT